MAGGVEGGEGVGEEEEEPVELVVRRGREREERGEGVQEASDHGASLEASLAESRQLQHHSGER